MGLRRLLGSAAVLMMIAGGAAVAAEDAGRGALITKSVSWAATPVAAQMSATYPKDAKGVGFANLGCILGAGGLLTQCRVVGEAPQGFGFAAAALALAPTFKAHYAAGEEGASVLLPLEFDPPGPKPAIDPINCLAPLCVLEIAPGKASPAQP